MFSVESVKIDGKIDETRFLQAHRLARIIFESETPENQLDSTTPTHPHLAIDTWRERLSMQNANIVYIIDTITPVHSLHEHADTETMAQKETATPSSSYRPADRQFSTETTSTGTTIGFFFNYPRSRDGIESYHIWIAGIHPSARGNGIFPRLLDETRSYAKAAGHTKLTVSTFPDKFSRMYSILSRKDSGWEVVNWETVGVNQERKVIMKMALAR